MKAEELFDKTIGFEGLQKFIENYDSFGHVKAMIITIMKEYAEYKNKELIEEYEELKSEIKSIYKAISRAEDWEKNIKWE